MPKRIPLVLALLCAGCSTRTQQPAATPTQPPAEISAAPVELEPTADPTDDPTDDSADPDVIGLGDVGLTSGYSTAVPWPEGEIVHAEDQLAVKGTLDRKLVFAVIAEHVAEIEYCYGVPQRDDLVGSAKILFIITNTGKVGSSTYKEVTSGGEELAQCVVKAVKRWTFPKVEGEGVAIVEYPFSFAPR